MIKKIFGWGLLIVVIICAAWLMLSSTMISKTLFASDGYLITASEGAALRVENGGVLSLPGNSGSFGMTAYNPILKPLMGSSALLVFLMAIYGCVSLIKKYKQTA